MQKIKNFFSWVGGTPIGIIWGAICIFVAGALLIGPWVLVLILRAIGQNLIADRLCAWMHKRTTRFHF